MTYISNYVFCSSQGFRVHKDICELCKNYKCKVYKDRVKKHRRKKIEEIDYNSGITRSLLLKSEDVKGKKATRRKSNAKKNKLPKRRRSNVGKMS